MAKKRTARRLLDDSLLSDIALDNEYVYASSENGGAGLVAVRHDGSQRRVIVEAPGLNHLLVDDGIYATRESRFVRVDVESGVDVVLADAGARLWSLASDKEHLYGSILGSYPRYEDGGIVRVPKRGGELAWVVRGKSVGAFALDGTDVIYFNNHQLWRNDSAFVNARNPHRIVVHGDAVVWTEFDNNGRLAMVNMYGGDRRDLAPGGYTSGLGSIGEWIYWTQSQRKKTEPSVWRMKLGGEPEPLARFTSKAPALAGNENLVCWLDDCDGGAHALDPSTL